MPPDLSAGHCANIAYFTDQGVRDQRRVCLTGWEGEGPCPVIRKCRDWGLARPSEQNGAGVVFGGMSSKALERERRRLRQAAA